ncbi:hypothetical protein Pyn_05394 [Prunus yedoensis var. nudiflora]|uniref:Uncharacterized protein n=1 Tax=Prunus yedoensis var. nudiflora TaxID=2094558 RepID=A0A314ZMM8_PRUYE|nr:hypothetical protein Pyn_05394 [Prunus yedoensis var. nudiflora]
MDPTCGCVAGQKSSSAVAFNPARSPRRPHIIPGPDYLPGSTFHCPKQSLNPTAQISSPLQILVDT